MKNHRSLSWSSQRAMLLTCVVTPLLGRCTCAPEEPPPLTPAAVGTVVGEAFVEDPTQRSLGGAVVEVYGMSARTVSQEGMQFVLQPIPLGEHTILMTHPELDRSIRIKAKVEAPYQTVLLPAASTTLKSAASLSGTVSVAGGSPIGAMAFLVGGNSQQQSAVGDDGSFTLGMLPPGAGAKIAVAKNGYEVAMAAIDLAEGGNTLPSPVALSPTSAGNLTLRGRVVLDGLTDQRGTVVLLNGGAEVASTDQAGVYQFTALGPGLYSLRAQHPGYRSVELPQVALTTSGAQGLVDMFLAPGSDLDDGSGQDEPVLVSLRNPLPGQTLQGGAPVVLAADVSGRIVDATDVVWHVRDAGDSGAGVELGRGFIVTGSLPLVSERTVMEILVSVVSGGATLAQDHVLVYVDRLLLDVVEVAHRTGYGIQPADVEEVLDAQGRVERVRYRIQQGQPIELTDPRGLLGERMVFVSDTGHTFFGVARLGELEVGTHVFDVAVTDESGLISHTTIEVIVSPLQFAVTLASPVASPATPYYAYQGLPVSATVQHGFQTFFPQQSVSWEDTVGRPVANGLSATIRSLPAGDGVIAVEVTDVAGNVRSASRAYRLEDVEFTAAFNAPAAGSVILASASLTVNIGYTHTYQPPINPTTLQVTLHSNRQANLRPSGASTASFGVNQDVTFSSLVPGVHTLTARIFDGSRYTEATRQITVQSSYVTAQLVEPTRDLVLFDGVAVAFAVQVAASMGDTPLVSWYLDGSEFDASWGSYGTDAASALRHRIDLGAYSSSTAPFSSARWSGASSHTVQAFVRLPGVTGACRSIPDQAHCLSVHLDQLPPLTDKGDLMLTSGMTDTWSGAIRLTGRTEVDGGELIIEPGTTIVVQHDPENFDYRSGMNRGIHFVRGRLTIGGTGGLVRFGNTPRTTGSYDGLTIMPVTDDTAEALVTIRNTVFVGTRIQHFYEGLIGANRSFVVTDTSFEDELHGLVAYCPTLARNLSFRRLTSGSYSALVNHSGNCPTAASYSDLVFEDVYNGLLISYDRPDREVTLQRLTVDGYSYWGVYFSGSGGHLDLIDSQFRHDENTSCMALHLGNSDPAHPMQVRVQGNQFSDLAGSALTAAWGTATIDEQVLGNRFERCGVAIRNDAISYPVQIEAHLNSFIANVDDIVTQQFGFTNATGNFMGDPGDRMSSHAAFNAVDPGRPVDLQRIEDGLDSESYANAVVDNMLAQDWLTPDDAPLAYIELPRQSRVYRTDQCIPLTAAAPLSGIDPVADCRWYRFAPGTDPLAGIEIFRDLQGCLDTAMYAIADGIHGIALRCTDPVDSSRTSLLTTRILVDSTSYSGEISVVDETWSGVIDIDGDVVVPAGHTLTIAPGTVVRFGSSDGLRDGRHYVAGSESTFYGSRDKVDLVIQGTLLVQGEAGNRVRFEASHGVPVANSWGSILVWPGAVVDLRHCDLESATHAIHGVKVAQEPQYAPQIYVQDTRFEGLSSIVREVCPVQFERVLGLNLAEFMSCSAFTDLLIRDTTVANTINFAAHSATFSTFPESVLGVLPRARFERLVLSEPPQPSYIGLHCSSEFGSVDVADSLFSGQATSIQCPGTIAVSGSEFRDFTQAFHVASSPGSLSVSSSVFLRGTRILASNSYAITSVVTGSLVRDVTTPFEVTYAPLEVTGCQIENASRVLISPHGSGCSSRLSSVNLTGNNLIAPTEFFVNLNYSDMYCNFDWETFVVDLQGSYLNGLTDQGSIEALLFDPRTDASSADTLVGHISYGTPPASPLSLTLPTPRP